ncbi:hypothetical protein TNIN_146411 [Trichonephila inaurata madagascariensis]|uniref:Uncharacterized protein n=1 Tax=Trichonephila inaurata madagascariensis TaxID=2747483 RepID=A0A8X7C2M0_9ARAC|nr:hypothetical protein TNIN_146411 [Trichonephila inaurata madagascariensis]
MNASDFSCVNKCSETECRREESNLSSSQQRPAETRPLTMQLLLKGLNSMFADSDAHSIRLCPVHRTGCSSLELLPGDDLGL